MLTFLTNNAWKVYLLFDTKWSQAQDIFDLWYTILRNFILYSLSTLQNSIIPYAGQLYYLAVTYYFTLVYYATSLAANLTIIMTTYFNNLWYLIFTAFSNLQFFLAYVYSNVVILALTWYSNLVSLASNYYSKIVSLFGIYYVWLLKYLVDWYLKAQNIFDFLYSSIVYLTSLLIMTGINSLINLYPKIVSFTDLPLPRLLVLLFDYYIDIVRLAKFLGAHVVLFATSGVKVITSIIPVLSKILTLVIGDFAETLLWVIVDAMNGFPVISDLIIDKFKIWLEDTILDLIETAIDRFW